jgi:Rps23 Pro-64 3,4-dihydroxylase Tpa1-like proline 4-hydroxylase
LVSQHEQQALTLQQKTLALAQKLQALDEKTLASEQKALVLQQELQVRDRQVELFKEELETRQQQALKLEQDRAALMQQYAAAQTNIMALNQQLRDSTLEGVLSREKLSELEDQVRRRLEQSVALQQQMADLARSNQIAVLEKERLAGKLELAEHEKQSATEKVTLMQEQAKAEVARMEKQVKAEQENTARLTESYKALATKQTELTPNAIFSEFLTNRVDTQIFASRAGIFGGDAIKKGETQTVLVNNGTNTYALCHVQETPLSLSLPGVDWESFTGTLSRNAVSLPIRSLSFAAVDPRIVLIPLTAAEAGQLGCRAYQVCADPYKFQDAVLVGAREGYYGQCSFQIELTTPDYVKLDRNVLKGLFGKFNPSRGDLVFSKAGELLGVMANSTYCLMLRRFDAEATFRCGQDGHGQRTGGILAALYAEVADLPSKLQ